MRAPGHDGRGCRSANEPTMTPGARGSPPGRLSILARIRAGAVDAVHRPILGRPSGVERRCGEARIAGEEDALIAADRDTGHRAHVVAPGLQGRSDAVEQVALEAQHVARLE